MNASTFSSWQFWAVLSAVFAALTAIFAKVGVENVNSDLATFIRTIVVVCVLGLIVYATRQFQNPADISGRTYLFLLLSGLGTGASWLCYFRALKLGNAAQVAPIDKLSVVLVAIFGVLFLGERLSGCELARRRAGRGRRDPGGGALKPAGRACKGADRYLTNSLISSITRSVAGSFSRRMWFCPCNGTNRAPGIPAASSRPASNGCT